MYESTGTYQNHVVDDDSSPERDLAIRIGEGVEEALLPLLAVEHLLADLGAGLQEKDEVRWRRK